MKLYIYIALFVILIIYVNSHSNYLKEKFTDQKSINNFDAPSPYEVLKTDKLKPILIDGNSNLVPGYDDNSTNIYGGKYWKLKTQGFSDIFNYEDKGGLDVFLKATNMESKLNVEFAPVKKEEKQAKIFDQKNKKIIPKLFEYNSNKYNLIGTAVNKYYKQYYYLYEFLTKQNINDLDLEENIKYLENNRIFEYLLVKVNKNVPKVSHYVGPRNKININDVVYFSFGTFQLGPLSIKKL
jgi:hypothetical protein